MRFWLFFIVLSSFCATNYATTVYVNKPDSTYNITSCIEFLEDRDHKLTIESFLNGIQHDFEKNDKKIFHKGNTPYSYWVKFDVVNHLRHEVLIYLSAEWLNLVEVYEVKNNKIIRYREMGAALNADERALAISKPAVLLPFTDGMKHTIYMRFKTDHALTTTVSIATMKVVYKHFVKESVIYHIFLGVIVLIFFYNIYLSVITRRGQYILFTLYILFLVLSVSYVKGFHTLFHSVYFTKHSNVFTALMFIFLIFSMTSMTEIEKYCKIIYRARFVVTIVPLISILYNLFGSVRIANLLIDLSALIGIIWGIALALKVIRMGGSYAKNIILAFGAFIIGGAVQILLGYGVFEVNFWTTNAYVIGSGLEVLFLSSALAIKINQFRKDRYLAQKEKLMEIKKNENLVREQNQMLEEKVLVRTRELEQTNQDLERTLKYVQEQKLTIEENNKYIIDGIKYAKTIQDAILTPPSELRSLLLKSFIYYRPKDILSGDFYWFGDRGDEVIIAALDCEGHGVSGAMLSMMGYAFMNEIVYDEGISNPGDILQKLHAKVEKQLYHSEKENADTMDVAVVTVNKAKNEVQFAGARNPLVILEGEELTIVRGNRFSIGEKEHVDKGFDTHTFHANNKQCFFIFSDGYQDQFGGPDGKKMMARNFRTILRSTCVDKTGEAKTQRLHNSLINWQGNQPQTDDILVIGFGV